MDLEGSADLNFRSQPDQNRLFTQPAIKHAEFAT